jgi:hypothetical protein
VTAAALAGSIIYTTSHGTLKVTGRQPPSTDTKHRFLVGKKININFQGQGSFKIHTYLKHSLLPNLPAFHFLSSFSNIHNDPINIS